MERYDGSIRINTKLLTKEFDRDANHLKESITKLGSGINRLMGALGVAIGVAGLVKLGKQAIETASDIEEVQNVVDTAFGDMAYKMEQFADTAVKQFGMSRLSAKEMGSTFMAMGASMVDSMEDASNMAISLTGRAADMASFYNKTAEETATALKSIYTGETETLKTYGVVMTEINLQEYAAEKGIRKKISAMTQAEKVQLRYNYVMEQTSLAAGDFAKTSDSWANQTRILSEQFKELLSVIGTGLIPVFTPIVKSLNTILTQLIAIASQAGAVMSKLFGVSIPVADTKKFSQDMSAAAGGAGELADGVEEAGKEAKKALAPFDDLVVLADKAGGKGKGTGAGAAGGGFEVPKLDMKDNADGTGAMGDALDNLLGKITPVIDRFRELKGIFEPGFFDGLGENWEKATSEIVTDAQNIIDNLTGIFTDPAVVASAQSMFDSIAYALGQVAGSFASVGITIAQNLIGGFDIYLEQSKEFLKKKLVSIFDIVGDISLLIGTACETIAYIFEAFGSENGQQLTANIIGIFTNTTLSLLELAGQFGRDILGCIITPITENKDGLRTALEGLLGTASTVSQTILDAINHTFEKLNEVYGKYIKPFFDSINRGLSELLSTFLKVWNEYAQPILDSWGQKFDELIKDHIQPMVDNFLELIGLVAEILTRAWENVFKPILGWFIEVLVPAIADICDIIFGIVDTTITYIADIINGIIEIVNGVIDLLIGLATGDWKRAWNGFAEVVEGIKDVIKGIINAIIGIVEGMANSVITAINTILRAVNSFAQIKNPLTGKVVWSADIPELSKITIPRLANGAVIRGGNPFIAMLGDQPRGKTNIEAPADLIKDMARQGIREELSGLSLGGGSANQIISLNVDGQEFARLTLGDFFSEMHRQGYNVEVLGVT